MTTRRAFLQNTAAALAATALPLGRGGPGGMDRVGVQLYTVREAMRQDVEGTLARVAEIGFREVEFAGYFGRTPAQIRAALTANGLDSPAAHVPYESLGDGWARVLDDANAIGHRYVIVAWTPQQDRSTVDGWKRVAEKFNRAGEAARAAGLTYAYHNHDFEFAPLEGRVPFDVLLEATDPALVQIEMDLYWITLGGGDPFSYFPKYPGRFPAVHVKDLKRGATPPMVDVGAGDIDWRAIFARREQAGIRHYFVEHDTPPDPFGSIRAGYEYLRALRLG